MICFALFRNGHFHNVVSTFTNVVHINVENDNVVSTLSNVVYINVEIHNSDSMLFNVVNSNVEIHNVFSTLIWRCPTSRRRIIKKVTLKQRWNVCWGKTLKISEVSSQRKSFLDVWQGPQYVSKVHVLGNSY